MRTFVLLICVASISLSSICHAYQPKDPKVQAMLQRAVTYLENPPENVLGNKTWMNDMGGKALIAYAVYKVRKDAAHPLIADAKDSISKFIASEYDPGAKEVYSIGVALSFLTEFEDQASQAMSVQLFQRLLRHQHKNGAFAYEGHGDTSVTQYAVLGMWSAKTANIIPNFPMEPVERACNWLLRTQAPAGNWAYHGKDPGSYTRIPQPDRPTLACFTAGAGSLYICADVLNIRKQKAANSGSPFTSVSKQQSASSFVTKAVDHSYFWSSVGLADQFWSTKGRLEAQKWHYYYMYGQERYLSFRNEILGLKEPKTGPPWYNAGVDYLGGKQRGDGSWNFEQHPPPIIDTSFAVLFLVRSTKTKIHPPTSGILLGGQGIPDNFKDAVQNEDGKVVAPTKSNKVEDLNTLIRAMQDENFDADGVELGDLIIRKEVEKSQLDILREQVKHPSYQVRLSTVRVLAKGGLENAPVLIYALSDPDNRIFQEARDALRLMSRKLQGYGLGDNPDEEQKKIAQRRWSEWLRSIRPDLEF